ncbi:serine hydrolase domain-containing protein [Gordonia paraffinivorans]|uniref:serine hydrolase domain-containing protein n=1 Tax=Gordonia paraffinivorans TaxID=175628 RepID=UPI003FCD9B6A
MSTADLDTVDPERIEQEAGRALRGLLGRTPRIPGVVAGVTTDRRTVHLDAVGVRSIDDGSPMTTDSVFVLFSTSKAITATVALQLVERGELDLHAPASEYAPAIGDLQVITGFDADGTPRSRPTASPITTHHLLTHTAGFGYSFFNETYRRLETEHRQPSISTATMAALRTPLLFDPGTRWEYGSNIDWAGQVIEGITGRRLGEEMHDRVFAPLGMSDTGFHHTESTRHRHVTMHHRRGDDLVAEPWREPPAAPEVQMGGQGLHSTVGDYLRFMRMWLADGRSDSGERILSPETVAMAMRNHLGDLRIHRLPGLDPRLTNDAEFFPGMTKSWSYAFMINDSDAPTGRPAGSQSWAGLANLYYWLDPLNKIGGFWATQVLPFFDPASVEGYLDFESAVYRALSV